ncbi:hypothetical protein RND81_14G102000 [Saponaria officinalis]|uniref:Transmembrane protein n=1 Tax=Saponaria officinalis TaxID=3572 RepID=A0AAW1GN03_SAPOF
MIIVLENLGCSIDCGVVDPNQTIVSKCFSENKDLFSPFFCLSSSPIIIRLSILTFLLPLLVLLPNFLTLIYILICCHFLCYLLSQIKKFRQQRLLLIFKIFNP